MDIEEELINRYIYLNENKELILALCIKNSFNDSKDNIKKKLNEIINNNDTLLNIILSKIENIGSYYIYKDVEEEIINMFEEFILGNKEYIETDLYKHIEAVKNNPAFLENFTDMINEVKERRNDEENYLDAFTVWKILDYIRRKYSDNGVVIKSLDHYYNLERYTLFGIDCDYGYDIPYNESDEKIIKLLDNDFNSENEIEIEDNYLCFHNNIKYKENYYHSKFAMKLYETSYIKNKEQILKKGKKRIICI